MGEHKWWAVPTLHYTGDFKTDITPVLSWPVREIRNKSRKNYAKAGSSTE